MVKKTGMFRLPNPKSNSNPKVMALEQIDVNLVQRNILADKPRVTRFHIPWDDKPAAQQQQQQEGQGMMQGQDMAQIQQQQQMQMQMQMQQQQQMQGLAARDPNSMNPALGHDMMAQQKLSHLAAEQQATGMDMD